MAELAKKKPSINYDLLQFEENVSGIGKDQTRDRGTADESCSVKQ